MPMRTRVCCRLLFGCLIVSLLIPAAAAGTFEVGSRREIGMMKRKIRAAQFLRCATFGPTIEQIESLAERMAQIGVRRACEEWIDAQMALPPGFHRPLAVDMIERDGLDTTQDGAWI